MPRQFHPRKQPQPPDPKKWKPHDKESWIFISQAIDTYGLNPYEFRVLAHVARRAGNKGVCNASQETISNACGIGKRNVMEALKTLCSVGILSKTRTGRSNHYKLQKSSEWANPSKLQEIRAKQTQKQ